MRYYVPLALVVVLGSLVACDSGGGPRSPVGFRLPQGDVEQGKGAFLEYQCNSCHVVAGLELPPATVAPATPVSVVLGGEVFEVRTDGYLVTSIINPSHKLASGYPEGRVTTPGGESRMPDFSDIMTVRQLIDLVAFLQSTYTVVPPPQAPF